MRGYSFLFFILAIPVIAALGHDIYITYHDQNFNKTMMFSDVGYLWTHYSPETYDWAKKNLSQKTWSNFLTPFLEQMTLLIAAIPLITFGSVLGFLKLCGLPPFRDAKVMRGHKKGQFGFGSGDKKQGRFKYKRK